MDDKRPFAEILAEAETQIIHDTRMFAEKLESGTSDPEQMMSFDEIELSLANVIQNANKTYLKLLSDHLSNLNEDAIIRAKKASTQRKE